MTLKPDVETVLYFKAGTSDKEYRAGVVWDGLEYHAVFRWGRRNGTLQVASKACRSERAAKALVASKLIEKQAKGYRFRLAPAIDPSIKPVSARKPRPVSARQPTVRLRPEPTQPAPPPVVTTRRVKLKD